MRVVLGLAARADNGSTPEERQSAITEALQRAQALILYAFPARAESVSTDVWLSPDQDVALLTYSNEHEGTAGTPAPSSPDRVSVLGYTTLGQEQPLRPQDIEGDLLRFSAGLSGCFALIRASRGRIEAVTDVTRSQGMYVAESPRLRILSSRALLAHLIQRWDQTGELDPRREMNLVAIRHMAVGGYFLGGFTPFRGVDAMDAAEMVSIDPWYVRRRHQPSLSGSSNDLAESDYRQLVHEVATALVASFDPIPGGQLGLSLTGGRDSRLLAAALANRDDFDVSTSTMGMPPDPDVVIAQQLSSIMRVPHHVTPPAGVIDEHHIYAEDPMSRIVRALDVHDGMTSGWDDIEDYGPMVHTPRLSGVGGEILRGGLVLPEMDVLDPGQARQRLANLLTGGPYFNDTYVRSARAFAAPLLELAEYDIHAAIDDFYYQHRNGRWVTARRSGARFRRRTYDPLLDNRFVRLVRQAPADLRWSERLAFDVIATLAPPMRDLPIEGSRWRFERSGPSGGGPDEAETWGLREALVRTAATSNYSWQRLQDAQVRERMKEIIFDGLNGPAAELFDRGKLASYLAPQELRYPAIVWHIATAVVMLSTPWHKTLRLPRVSAIRITLPTAPTA